MAKPIPAQAVEKVTREWDQRLREEGLAPIWDGDQGQAVTPVPVAYETGAHVDLAPRARAEFWRQVERAAADLPYGWPRGKFVRLAAQLGNVNRAARECGITQKAGEWAWRRFLVFAGLPAPLVKGSQGRKRPTKDGQRRVEAGRFREARAA